MKVNLPSGVSRYAPDGHPHTHSMTCKRSCCWTPMGHSTVRDQLPSWHRDACHCHDQEGRRS